MFIETILNPFIENIKNKSDRKAFCIADKYYTYGEFGKIISKIRRALDTSDSDVLNVGLVVNDDIETYASILALWMEGKCYVPLHPNQPIDRCLDIMNQIDSTLILDSSVKTRYEGYEVIMTNQLNDVDSLYLDNLKGKDKNLAYIIFTSGSTGKPKGVQISRKNVSAFIDSFKALDYDISGEDKFLQCTDLTFDVSVVSYLYPLLLGACQYTVPLDVIKYSKVYELLEDYDLNVTFMVPSIVRYLRPYFDEIELPSLRYCIFAGEALNANLVDEWRNCAPNSVMVNAYGPTEGTVYVTAYTCVDKKYNGIYSIGKPLKNVDAIIVDANNQLVKVGEKGELCISGDQQTYGYFKNEEKNKEAFFILNNLRYYRTGDLCFEDCDGDIMYVGRKDSQVKIQGFRIELSEIEFHAMDFLKGVNCVALAYENEKCITDLAFFIESEEFDTSDMINYMRNKMPSYMVPSKIYFEPTFPLNSNGKIDKVKLKSMIK